MASRQAPRASERKIGLDSSTGDGSYVDELARRRRHVVAACDRLSARPASSSLQGGRRQAFDADSARRVLRRGIDQVVGRRGRGAVRARLERPLDRLSGVRRRPGPDRPARPEERRRHARHGGLPRPGPMRYEPSHCAGVRRTQPCETAVPGVPQRSQAVQGNLTRAALELLKDSQAGAQGERRSCAGWLDHSTKTRRRLWRPKTSPATRYEQKKTLALQMNVTPPQRRTAAVQTPRKTNRRRRNQRPFGRPQT